MKVNVKLSVELEAIFNQAYKRIRRRGGNSINLDQAVSFVLCTYLQGIEKGEKLECEELIGVLRKLGKTQSELIHKWNDDLLNIDNPIEIPLSLVSDSLVVTSDLRTVLERCKEAKELHQQMLNRESSGVITINTGEFIIAALTENSSFLSVIKRFGITGEEMLKNALDSVIKNEPEERRISDSSNEDEDEDAFNMAGESEAVTGKKVDPNSKTPNLDQFAINMNKWAADGKYDSLVGRDKEIELIIEILCCRKKNNAVLLGDPGCGKSAVVEGLAGRIVSGNVPYELQDKTIFALDLNSLVAGCIYRGQYEERLQKIIKEVIECKDIIVYIDEFHNLIGNGGQAGQGDAANILKPYLARGEFQCIGATTTDEYRRFIEKDGALKRRFNTVFIPEPSAEETLHILEGLEDTYGDYHKVSYTHEVLEKCVEWSGRYISDRFFPDKAIGILDMASSCTKLDHPKDTTALQELESKSKAVRDEKQKAIEEDRFEEAAILRDQEIQIKEDIEKEKEKLASISDRPQVTMADLSKVISRVSGVPVDRIMTSDLGRLRAMKETLKKRVIGQDQAVDELTLALQRNILGLRDQRKPIAAFLLVGPTGCGKTLISRVLAEEFMGSEKNLETIACSEYMNDWGEAKLLGSAPGYVGFENTTPRLYVLKQKPYCVLLIDEIEKSSSKLYNIWLGMLEEGEVTLSSGEKVSTRNCIIIFTGNVGTKSLEVKGSSIGFTELTDDGKKKHDTKVVIDEVKKEFRPEFLNRLTKVIVFNSLGKEELDKIFDIELGKLQDRLKEKIKLTVTEKVKNLVVSKCEPKYGARSLQRLLIEYVEQEICKSMLDDPKADGKTKAKVDLDKDEKIKVTWS